MSDYELSPTDARLDWRQLATEVADGCSNLPPENLLRAIGEKAGGLPEGISARQSLRATAEVIRSLRKLEK